MPKGYTSDDPDVIFFDTIFPEMDFLLYRDENRFFFTGDLNISSITNLKRFFGHSEMNAP